MKEKIIIKERYTKAFIEAIEDIIQSRGHCPVRINKKGTKIMFNINKKKEIGNINIISGESVKNLIAYYYIKNPNIIKYIKYDEYQIYCRNKNIGEIFTENIPKPKIKKALTIKPNIDFKIGDLVLLTYFNFDLNANGSCFNSYETYEVIKRTPKQIDLLELFRERTVTYKAKLHSDGEWYVGGHVNGEKAFKITEEDIKKNNDFLDSLKIL